MLWLHQMVQGIIDTMQKNKASSIAPSLTLRSCLALLACGLLEREECFDNQACGRVLVCKLSYCITPFQLNWCHHDSMGVMGGKFACVCISHVYSMQPLSWEIENKPNRWTEKLCVGQWWIWLLWGRPCLTLTGVLRGRTKETCLFWWWKELFLLETWAKLPSDMRGSHLVYITFSKLGYNG